MTLHVTNGDVVVGTLRAAGIADDALSWIDVLHEGPVPEGDDESLRRVRARFHADSGWASFEDSLAALRARDRRLAEADDVFLWFEADLFDQLQLVQILASLRSDQRVRLICIGEFPGRLGFAGLGELTPGELASLEGAEHDVSGAERELGRAAWAAFRSPDPCWIEEVARDASALPFLAAALVRHLEQFPSTEDGLSRTERTLLESVPGTREELCTAQAEREERPFMGDTTVFAYLDRLAAAPAPLLADVNGRLERTEAGDAVLAGAEDAVRLNGIDRRLGGVRLEGSEAAWRWDRGARQLIAARLAT